jgi:hypothetical protein
MLPGLVSAARVSKFTDHFVFVSCAARVSGDVVQLFAEKGAAFADASFGIWKPPADPLFDDPTYAGSTETAGDVGLTETATGATVALTLPATDQDGNDLGLATLTASLTKSGAPFQDPPPPKGNHHSATVVIHQPLAGNGTFTAVGTTYNLPCTGEILDITVSENSPTSFVFSGTGVSIDCFWETGDSIATFSAFQDATGFFMDAYLLAPGVEAFSIGQWTGSMNASSVTASINLTNGFLGDPMSASASATFALVGDPVTSIIIRQNVRQKITEQALAPTGSLAFSTGESFTIDTDHCSARTFVSRVIVSAPKGPKTGPAPANDAPDGAIALKLGGIVNAQTTATVLDAEVPITTCPEGVQDDLGHTLWYTFTGNGNPVTVDTSGSNFDTVVAVYTRDGETFNEVGCEDDVAFQPIGASFQAILTVDTAPNVTYYVQAGGFLQFFSDDSEKGRLRLSIK